MKARLLVFGSAILLTGCVGPLGDPAGQNWHHEWIAQHGHPTSLDGEADIAFVYGTKAAKDYEYGNYVHTLRRATSWGEFGSDSIKIVLDSLVAVTGGVATKSALGAASAGVTSATTSLKKNVLFDQSITTFINKMDALRLTKWNEILCKLHQSQDPNCKRDGKPYPVAEAFVDLEEYGRLGTLDAALRDVDTKTSAEKTEAVEQNKVAKGVPPQPTPAPAKAKGL